MSTLNSANVPLYVIQPQTYSPNTDQWGLSVQQRLKRRFTLELALLNSMGIHLLGLYDSNQPTPEAFCSCFRHTPRRSVSQPSRVFEFCGTGSTYYGGDLKLIGSLFRGFDLQLVYRYAKCHRRCHPALYGPAEPSVRAAEHLLSARRPFSIALFDASLSPAGRDGDLSHVPFHNAVLANWRVATVITAQTGLPFTPQLAINGLNDGGIQLPNRVGNGALPSDQRSYLHWFNTSLDPFGSKSRFSDPLGNYQYGNSGFDILRGPGLVNVDASAGPDVFAERTGCISKLASKAFNALNPHEFWATRAYSAACVHVPGAIDHTATPSRQTPNCRVESVNW